MRQGRRGKEGGREERRGLGRRKKETEEGKEAKGDKK